MIPDHRCRQGGCHKNDDELTQWPRRAPRALGGPECQCHHRDAGQRADGGGEVLVTKGPPKEHGVGARTGGPPVDEVSEPRDFGAINQTTKKGGGVRRPEQCGNSRHHRPRAHRASHVCPLAAPQPHHHEDGGVDLDGGHETGEIPPTTSRHRERVTQQRHQQEGAQLTIGQEN